VVNDSDRYSACKVCEVRMVATTNVHPVLCQKRVALEGQIHWCQIRTGHPDDHSTYCDLRWAA